MNTRQLSGITAGTLGAIILIIGAFIPVISLFPGESLNYFHEDQTEGIIVVTIGIISLFLLWLRSYKILWLTGLCALVATVYTLANFHMIALNNNTPLLEWKIGAIVSYIGVSCIWLSAGLLWEEKTTTTFSVAYEEKKKRKRNIIEESQRIHLSKGKSISLTIITVFIIIISILTGLILGILSKDFIPIQVLREDFSYGRYSFGGTEYIRVGRAVWGGIFYWLSSSGVTLIAFATFIGMVFSGSFYIGLNEKGIRFSDTFIGFVILSLIVIGVASIPSVGLLISALTSRDDPIMVKAIFTFVILGVILGAILGIGWVGFSIGNRLRRLFNLMP
jgi:hypothetical protein